MRRALGVLGGLCLGVALSQFPEYAQQYTQRLGGAVDELKVITEEFDASALSGGLTRQQALDRYVASADAFLKDRGVSMERTFGRYDHLRLALEQVQGADALERLRNLPDYLDSEIGSRTLENFKPAVPVTAEGFLYAGAGFLAGYLVVSALVSLVTLPFRRRTRVYRTR
ncbi:DUF2937 family protein [Paradevosia shaoguanensis]|uniref:DUF2937 family protein n=1 Tax=Paradevosia shaoguanensis TaxID=1335043 RepID=UPI0019342B7A|nr:DUF2937 family protein [Paradevosia shaoguanensis]